MTPSGGGLGVDIARAPRHVLDFIAGKASAS